MNLRREPAPHPKGATADRDTARVREIWTTCRSRAGDGGPFLFGEVFTDADAVLAPVLALLDAHLPDMLRLHNSIYEGLHQHGPLLEDYIAQLKETRAAGNGAFLPVARPGRHLRHVVYDTLPILARKNLKRLILIGLALVYLVLSFLGVFRSGVSQRAVQEFKDNESMHIHNE